MQLRLGSLLALSFVVAHASACSAIVSPDTNRLGGGSGELDGGTAVDASSPTVDAWAPPGVDAALDAARPADPDAWVPPAVDAGCVAAPSCTGGVVTACEGGVLTRTECPLGCATGEARCAAMVPSNVDPALLGEGTVDLELRANATFDTSTCTSTMATSRAVTQSDGSELCALLVRSLRVAEGVTVRITGTRPLAILASGEVSIAGVIDVSATGTAQGPGGSAGGTAAGPDGSGARPGLRGAYLGTYSDGGGGGGAHCGAGAQGGSGGTALGGTGGAGLGSSTLEPLTGGSGGGIGFGGYRGSGTGGFAGNYGLGGGGGGSIQISAAGGLTITGSVLAGGGGGAAGGIDDRYSNWGAGGGGGAGGGILLEAPTVDVRGRVLASGGGGGAGGNSSTTTTAGSDGRDEAGRASGGTGGGTYGSTGGASGGGGDSDGLLGGSNTTNGANGGGGGGGAGCIVIRSASGSTSATFSPTDVGYAELDLRIR